MNILWGLRIARCADSIGLEGGGVTLRRLQILRVGTRLGRAGCIARQNDGRWPVRSTVVAAMPHAGYEHEMLMGLMPSSRPTGAGLGITARIVACRSRANRSSVCE